MTDAEFDAALDEVIARTGVSRYRHLVSDANTLPAPNDPATWRRWVVAEAARDPHLPPIAVDYGTGETRPCGGCPGSLI